MKKIWIKILVLLIFVSGLMACGIYSADYYYQGKFALQTWVNGTYITGMTVEEANTELLKAENYHDLLITDGNKTVFDFKVDDFGLTQDFKNSLTLVMIKQADSSLLDKIKNIVPSQITPEVSFDTEIASNLILSSNLVADNKTETDREYKIEHTNNGYQLINETTKVLDKEKLVSAVETALTEKAQSIDITDCYYDLEMTPKMAAIKQLYEKVDAFQSFHMVYQFGDTTEEITPAIVADWITVDAGGNFVFDEQGNLILNETKVLEYINKLCDKYDTLDSTRKFQSTRGDIVTIEGGTYGNLIDRDAEYAYLLEAFKSKNEEARIPVYLKKALYQGLDDIGDTYIEIDMTTQTMYYYENGECKLQTPIVTGNLKWNMGTPARVCYVYAKLRNRILKGPGYAAHVNYWMPVNGSIGIHDAKWRDEFGGEIYKTQGSHGCINTPYDAMKELFGMVEIGTPVVMFY